MLDSVRVRLTLWYTGLLALFLVLLSLITYFISWRSTLRRTDSNLTELSEAFLTTVQAEMLDNHGSDAARLAAQEAIVEHRFRDHVFAVLDPKGNQLTSSQDLPNETSPAGLLSSPQFQKLLADSAGADRLFENMRGGRSGYRALVGKFTWKGQTYTLVILQSLHPQNEMLEEVRATFAWVIPIAIFLASIGGYFLARKSLAPVVAMSSKAGRIGAENLHERLPIQNAKDELGRLAASFNELLERVDESFERQRRFMSDASHELRTPAAILRGESEVALSCERSGNEYALNVRDSGPGIPEDLQQRVFERFFRVDKARTHSENDGGGAGLGLSIARWIAEAHHGRLILARSDSSGSTFTALLPAIVAAMEKAPSAR